MITRKAKEYHEKGKTKRFKALCVLIGAHAYGKDAYKNLRFKGLAVVLNATKKD